MREARDCPNKESAREKERDYWVFGESEGSGREKRKFEEANCLRGSMQKALNGRERREYRVWRGRRSREQDEKEERKFEISWNQNFTELDRYVGGGASPTLSQVSVNSNARGFSATVRNWFGRGNGESAPSTSAATSPNPTMLETAPIDEFERHSDLCVGQTRKIQRSDIRLVIFNENDQRLLYDSETVISIEDKQLDDARKGSCGRFYFLRHRSDIPQIGRMVFGTLPTSSKTGSLKFHALPQTNSVMLSRVFFVPKASKFSGAYDELNLMNNMFGSESDCQSQLYATVRSLDTLRDDLRRKNSSADPPRRFHRIRNSSLQMDTDDTIHEEVRAFSPSQLSKNRRKQLSLRGLADEGPAVRWGSRSRMSSCSSVNDSNDDQKQIGFALIFDAKERDFLFQHILQIEREILKLETGIYKASLSRSQFFYCVYQAYKQFANSICLLYNSLRLRQPVWLSLLDPQQQNDTAQKFCSSLAKLIEQLDRKETHFFLSTLLSAVLMNHLAWVASVAPPDTIPQNERSLLLGTSVIDASGHPYNVRLAQLMDLFGIVGGGDKLAKTVIIGKNPHLISEILFVMSYFIRCSNVECRRGELLSPTRPSNPVNIVGSSSLNAQSDLMDDFMTDLSSSSTSQHIDPAPSMPIHPSARTKRSSSSVSSQFSPSLPDGSSKFPIDLDEPPPKTRAINPPSRIELIFDEEDVQVSGQELISSLIQNSLPRQASGTQSGEQSPASSSHSSQSVSSCAHANGDLGRSLLAGVCASYSPHFVLSGVDLRESEIEDTFNAIYDDVKHPTGEPCDALASLSSSTSSALTGSVYSTVHGLPPRPSRHRRQNSNVADSPRSSQKSTTIEGPTSAMVVVGDLTDYTVRIVSAENCRVEDQQVTSPSDAVVAMLEQFLLLYKIDVKPNFLISFLEDKLSGLLSKSQTLVKLITSEEKSECLYTESRANTSQSTVMEVESPGPVSPPKPEEPQFRAPNPPAAIAMSKLRNLSVVSVKSPGKEHRSWLSSNTTDEDTDDNISASSPMILSMERVCEVVGCDCSDLRLIVNVAAIYQPNVLNTMVL
ncbi:unnamed protein product [Bursaphelenchus xylophilus]|uniref:(pine wood nematode) hypothetical protein n=1 Tax=Bursaphelenchus xylophilus TaxID=6326 RepID=A0A1I7RIA3_BURXY|nr:unnamed protein product [Bursaphelenchus xylophilus]CAG9115050.1 unnamed protein product [Bursaphelenchus xylophilus]